MTDAGPPSLCETGYRTMNENPAKGTESGTYVIGHFRQNDEIWPELDPSEGRTDNYITAAYDRTDNTFSLTYHPTRGAITTHHFTTSHATLALRDCGYSFDRISRILDQAVSEVS